MDKQYLIKLAIDAALDAGKAIMQIYSRTYRIDIKEDNSPLTEADLASNKVIINYLSNSGIPVISEENKQQSYQERRLWDACWIVDPLDGTKEFINNNDEFTVNIAFAKNGVLQFGVIYAPALEVLYYTNASKTKAFKLQTNKVSSIENILFKEHTLLQPLKEDKDEIIVVASRSHLNETTKSFIQRLKENHSKVEMVSKGSSLKFCLVAEGKADMYPRFAPTMEWDTAAGQAICEAMGLKVLDIKTQSSMTYNRENLLNNSFLVCRNESSLP